MFGLGADAPTSELVDAVVFRPATWVVMGVGIHLVMRGRDTSEFIERLSWSKAAVALVCFVAAVLALTTQSHNPFLYFIF